MNALTDRAAAFRHALDRLPAALRPIALQHFPRGSCGDASNLLGPYLAERGFGLFELVSAERAVQGGGGQRQTHAWLRQHELVIDITADQFEEGQAPAMVSCNSFWHRTWEEQSVRRAADFRKAGSSEFAALNRAYFELARDADAG